MPQRLTPQDALVYTMLTMAASDSSVAEAELNRIRTLVRELPLFRSYDESRLIAAAQECARLLTQPGGFANVLRQLTDTIPAHLHETAYALAFEVAIADLNLSLDEQRFLTSLATTLGLSALDCEALERGARARHRLP